MNSPNSRQVGGSHYAQGGDFQHWDLVERYGLGYLEGCATKYIARHRSKNGKEDLEKALHYVEKLFELSNAPVETPFGGVIPARTARGAVPVEALVLFFARHPMEDQEQECFRVLCSEWNSAELAYVMDVIASIILVQYGVSEQSPAA